jgi:hypothetical protein
VLAAESASGPPQPPADDGYLVITGIDRLDGHEVLLAGPEDFGAGACGVLAENGEAAAKRFADALVQQTLSMLTSVADLRRRAAGLSFAAALAVTCRQVAATERGGNRWRGIFLAAAPSDRDPLFAAGLLTLLLPGAAAPARRNPFGAPIMIALAGVAAAAVAIVALGRGSEPSPVEAAPVPVAEGAAQAPAPEQAATASPSPAAPIAPKAPAPMPPGDFAFAGTPADSYAKVVAPACRTATQDLYPFFGNGTGDAPAGEVRRLFGPGGMLPSFFDQRLKPLVATDGPVWRWKPGAPAGLDPATPELLARLPALTTLIGSGLDISIEVTNFGGGVTDVTLALPGGELRFDRIGTSTTTRWMLSDRPADSSLALFKDGRQVRRYQEGGSWSLFRLIGKGRVVPEAVATLVTFSDGAHSVTFRLSETSGGQPFGRGGVWSFRCPGAL